jgi:type IV secretory pathway VirB10-like protein
MNETVKSPAPQSTPLTTKAVVGRSALTIFAILCLLGITLIGNRANNSIDLQQRSAAPPVSPSAGAPPSAFASPTTMNPYTPEYAARETRDPLQVNPDQLLRELAGRNTPTGGLSTDIQPVPSYDPSPMPTASPPAPTATNVIGTLDMRAPAVSTPVSTEVVAENQLRPGDILRVQLSGAVSSDFPGAPWIGLITQDVPLPSGKIGIPAGSRIIGTVAVLNGPNQPIMSRMGLASSTIVLPNGTLLSPQGYITDADGSGAVAGRTRHHLVAQGAGIMGAAILGAGAAISTSDEPESTRSALDAEVARGAASQATPFATKFLNVQPTVTLAAGQSVSVVLTAPLEIPDAS